MRTLQKAPDKADSVSDEPRPTVALLPQKSGRLRSILADAAFRSVVTACALSVVAVVLKNEFELVSASGLAMHKFGLKFLVQCFWDPVKNALGALRLISWTIVSSIVA